MVTDLENKGMTGKIEKIKDGLKKSTRTVSGEKPTEGKRFKRFRLNIDMAGNLKGQTLRLPVDPKGTVKNDFWRKRVKDSRIDNCVEEIAKPIGG